MNKGITRRELLGLAAAAPMAAGCAVYQWPQYWILKPPKPEEKWTFSFGHDTPRMDISVWPDGRIEVRKRGSLLRLVRRTKAGWRVFHGTHGTKIKLRRLRPWELEIDYVYICEPR